MPIARSSGGGGIEVKKYTLTEDLIVRDSTANCLVIDPNGGDRNIFLFFRQPRFMIVGNLDGNYKLRLKTSQQMIDGNAYNLSSFDQVLQVMIIFDGTDHIFTNYPGIDIINYG